MGQVLNAASALVALGLSVGVAMAQQPTQAQRDAIRNNCRSDFMSHCSSVAPGGIEALQCLQRNSSGLSAACQSAVNSISPPPAQPAAAPAAAPASTPARSNPPRAARTAAAPAAAPRQPTSQQRSAIRAACQADFISRCPGVQPGGSQALQCLKGHAPELSAACRHALAAIAPPGSAVAAPAAAPPVAVAPVEVIPPIPPLPLRVRLEILNICRAEQVSFCGNVPAGGGRLMDCLVANQTSISPGCRRALLWASR